MRITNKYLGVWSEEKGRMHCPECGTIWYPFDVESGEELSIYGRCCPKRCTEELDDNFQRKSPDPYANRDQEQAAYLRTASPMLQWE